jgi:hypothetical protein
MTESEGRARGSHNFVDLPLLLARQGLPDADC